MNSNILKKSVVSVLIPTYNHSKTVEKALNSLLLSDCKCIELILSDDCSVDNSYEIFCNWSDKHIKLFHNIIKLRQNKNLGINSHMNFLISIATGDYITGLAADDMLKHNGIDIQRKYLDKNTNIDFLYSNMGLIDFNDNFIRKKCVLNLRSFLIRYRVFAIIDMVFNWGIPWPRIFARRHKLVEIGQYPQEICVEDRWMAFKIFEKRRFAYINEVIHLYRIRGVDTGTGGIDPYKISEDIKISEAMVVNQTTGFLKVCLYAYIKSYAPFNKINPFKYFYLLLRKSINLIIKILP